MGFHYIDAPARREYLFVEVGNSVVVPADWVTDIRAAYYLAGKIKPEYPVPALIEHAMA